MVGIGTKKIIINAAGMWPNIIAATATALSLCDLTIAFHTACKKAAKITARNTLVAIIRFYSLYFYYCLLYTSDAADE